MRKLLLFTVVLLISVSVFADFVSRKDAEKVAKNHFYQSINNIKQMSWENMQLNCIYNPVENQDINYYVFNINGDQGWVMVSSDNSIQPILAYSFEGGFNSNNMSPAQMEMLKYYEDCIKFASETDMTSSIKSASEWDELLNYDYRNGHKQKSTSPILLQHINWNQSWPYNAQCPADPDGINGHVPVGCVATAMLQVMKYYNWPANGEGSKYHSNMANGGYGNITINFANQTYDWYSMPNEASSYVNEELGKINYHAGVGVSMTWGPNGSWSFTSRIVTALENYFKYSTSAEYVQKYFYSETNWKNLIIAQIDDNMPVVYSGSSTTTGHAWNCDGYQDDSFHMNWGWGGAGNGYYTLDNLTSTATIGGPENNFNQNQEMVINIYPREDYPAYCTGTKIITGKEGSFDDGSSNMDYEPNQSCVYVIDPECGEIVSVSFNDFDLAEGDELILFDGDESSTDVIETFDINNEPNTSKYTAKGGALTLKFNTNSTANATGWNIDYTVENCVTNIVYTDGSGSFGDGSGVCEYANSRVCSWYIQPENVNWITLTFDEFDLAGSIDNVTIYKTNTSSSNKIASFTASTVPTEPISVNTEILVVLFFSDGSETADGWRVNYTSSLSDIEQNKLLSNFSIMPNPGNINSRLEFTITNKSETLITITNILGEVVAVKEYNLDAGLHNIELSEIIANKLQAGVYSISVNANNQTKTQKLVVVE